MGIRLTDSHRAGLIAAVLLLCLCSAGMLIRYPELASWVESAEDKGERQIETLCDMGAELSEGNYILYNEYSKETDLSDVLEYYGQSPFELTRRYMDYGIFNADGESLLEDTDEKEKGYLTSANGQYYAFRAEFSFGDEGVLDNIQVDGEALDPETAYNIEQRYLSETEDVRYNYTISSISTPTDITVIYGMTEENLNAYSDVRSPAEMSFYNFRYATAYRETLKMMILLAAAAALLLPCIRRLDISGKRIFQVPFEIPAVLIFLLLNSGDFANIPAYLVYHTVRGTLLPGNGILTEAAALSLNFLMWAVFFGLIFWAVTSLRAMIRMKRSYWKERTLTAKLVRRLRKGENGNGGSVKQKAGGIFRKMRRFLSKQYDGLLHLDFRNRTNRMILKIVLINFAILFIVCLFWYYGTFALIVYSVILFFFLRKYTNNLQKKYRLLLKSTNQLAEGHLDVPIEGDIGLFNPIQDELKRIQKGFKKAVEEEVKNERMKTELVTNVSHDLRTPLTAIITYVDLLKNEKDEGKRQEYIQVLEKKSLRLKVLIEDLFEISKAASKSVAMHYMKVDIVDLLKQVGLENDRNIEEAGLEFRWKLPEHKLMMWLDSQKTYRIFENLIVNITKYAMPRTRVYIEMTETENDVRISMKNVSAVELDFNVDEITDRFVRGDASRNTEGSGLGLAIAKSFAELQHGTIRISTEADLFKAEIILPKSDIPEEEETVQNESTEQEEK